MAIFIVYMFLVIFVLALGMLGIYLTGLWKIFKKAGRDGWEAVIPFYNTWVLAEISGVAWWYALIIILSNFGIFSDSELGVVLNLVAIVANFFICYNLSKKFHKDIGIAILMVIFPFVMFPLIGFSKDFQYDKDVSVSENGPIGTNSNGNGFSTSDSNDNNYYSNETSLDKLYCQYCGKQLVVDSNFCGNCGNAVKK